MTDPVGLPNGIFTIHEWRFCFVGFHVGTYTRPGNRGSVMGFVDGTSGDKTGKLMVEGGKVNLWMIHLVVTTQRFFLAWNPMRHQLVTPCSIGRI